MLGGLFHRDGVTVGAGMPIGQDGSDGHGSDRCDAAVLVAGIEVGQGARPPFAV